MDVRYPYFCFKGGRKKLGLRNPFSYKIPAMNPFCMFLESRRDAYVFIFYYWRGCSGWAPIPTPFVTPHTLRKGLQTHSMLAGSPGAAVLQDPVWAPGRITCPPPPSPRCSAACTPQTEWILVDFCPCWTREICWLHIHTHAVHPSYNWARLSTFVASLIT